MVKHIKCMPYFDSNNIHRTKITKWKKLENKNENKLIKKLKVICNGDEWRWSGEDCYEIVSFKIDNADIIMIAR